GEIDDAIAAAARSVQELEADLRTRLATLPLWQGDARMLRLAPLPAGEDIHAYRQRTEQLGAARDDLLKRRRELDRRATDVARDIDELQLAGAVPTEADLDDERRRRDELWRQLREGWSHGATDAEPL